MSVENVTLHITNGSPPCRAVMMAIEAAGIKGVKLNLVEMMKGEHRSPEFLKKNPHHQVPTLEDNGFNLGESRTIMKYLVEQYGNNDSLYPKDIKQRAMIDRLLDYDLGTFYSKIVRFGYPQLFMGAEPDEALSKEVDIVLREFDTLYCEGKDGFLTGPNLTLADISMAASLTFLEFTDYDLSPYPNAREWVERIKALPFYGECNQGFEKFKEIAKSPKFKEMTRNRPKMADKLTK